MILTLVVGAVLASGYDIRTREIPNEISYSLVTLGVLFAALSGQLVSAGLAFSLMIPFVGLLGILGGMGAGDAKLLLAVSVFLGLGQTAYLIPVLLVAGSGFAVLYVVLHLVRRRFASSAGTSTPEATFEQSISTARLPFAPAILAAVIWVLLVPVDRFA